VSLRNELDLSVLERKLGYAFKEQALLRQAVTHRSYSSINNERLEFLGDGILDALIARMLYREFTRLSEGELSRFRSGLVCQDSLHSVALELGLGDYLRMGEGELKSGGFRRPSILADAFEAILGAVWLDGGYDAAKEMIVRLFTARIKALDPKRQGKDNKSLLQEWLQANKLELPAYVVIKTVGEAHEQEFTVSCTVAERHLQAIGVAMSRRAAEQQAAAAVYEQLIARKARR
jgi:ribonuclease-3